MIIYRYLSRELLLSTLAVGFVLGMVLVASRFVSYLADAASGEIPGMMVLGIMASRMPSFMETILPLALFAGALLSLGRLYMESEMQVMQACGIGYGRMLKYFAFPALCMSLIVGVTSLVLTPLGYAKYDELWAKESSRSDFELVSAGLFYTRHGQGVSRTIYAGAISEDKKTLLSMFVAEQGDEPGSRPMIVYAEQGQQYNDAETGTRYLKLTNGHRYVGAPGEADYEVLSFDSYSFILQDDKDVVRRESVASVPTKALFSSHGDDVAGELFWRFSLPVMVIIVVIAAIPLAKVNPRQGRFLKLIPAIVFYIGYFGLLTFARDAIDSGEMTLTLAVALVHGGFLLAAVVLMNWERGLLWMVARRNNEAA